MSNKADCKTRSVNNIEMLLPLLGYVKADDRNQYISDWLIVSLIWSKNHAFLVFLILIVVVFGGYYIHHHHKMQTKPTLTLTQSPPLIPPPPTTPPHVGFTT